MSDYRAPVSDMQFVLEELAGLDGISKLPGCEEVSVDLVRQVLEENAKFSAEVLAPLNHAGDKEGAVWKDGNVQTAKGFKEAYKQFVEGGWNALQFPADFGGQGLPKIVAAPVMEMWKSANIASRCVRCSPGRGRGAARAAPRSSRRPTCRRWSRASGPAP